MGTFMFPRVLEAIFSLRCDLIRFDRFVLLEFQNVLLLDVM